MHRRRRARRSVCGRLSIRRLGRRERRPGRVGAAARRSCGGDHGRRRRGGRPRRPTRSARRSLPPSTPRCVVDGRSPPRARLAGPRARGGGERARIGPERGFRIHAGLRARAADVPKRRYQRKRSRYHRRYRRRGRLDLSHVGCVSPRGRRPVRAEQPERQRPRRQPGRQWRCHAGEHRSGSGRRGSDGAGPSSPALASAHGIELRFAGSPAGASPQRRYRRPVPRATLRRDPGRYVVLAVGLPVRSGVHRDITE